MTIKCKVIFECDRSNGDYTGRVYVFDTRGEYAAFLEGVDIALQGDCIVEKIV